MIQKNSIQLKTISIILLIFLQGCTIQKNLDGKAIVTNKLVLDYLSEFSTMTREKPRAIIIRKNENSIITIKDLPEQASMEYLKKSFLKKDSISAGKIDNVLCFYYHTEIGKNEINYKNVPLRLQKRANESNKLVINDKEIFFSNDMIEWQPQLEIKYDIYLKKKVINNYVNRTEKTVIWANLP